MLIVFYSWQKELPNNTNRSFIEKSLGDAVKEIRNDDSISVEPRVDADTQGIPGSPDIGSAIFEKIKAASVFVADVSLITRAINDQGEAARQTPNPNVLIELGFAAAVLGWNRILMVMNTHFGPVEQLPFDLRKKRTLTYDVAPDADLKAPIRKQLEDRFESELRLIFEHTTAPQPSQSVHDVARSAIETQVAPRSARVRDFMAEILEKLDKSRPPSLPEGEQSEEAFISALQTTLPFVVEFTSLSRAVAEHNDELALDALLKGFDGIASSCFYGGRLLQVIYDHEYDFYRFAGHELLVTLVSHLIEQECWKLLGMVGTRKLYMKRDGQFQNDHFSCLSAPVTILQKRKKRLSSTFMSLHAEILKSRRESPQLAATISFDSFMDADYYLYFRTELPAPLSPTADFGRNLWLPHSIAYSSYRVPSFLTRATLASYGTNLAISLGFPVMDTFRQRLAERWVNVAKVVPSDYGLWQIGRFDPNTIGCTS
jgi:hypothetical protein